MSNINLSQVWEKNANFMTHINEESGEDVRNCYQCGKCSAGCPVAFAMDYRPNRIIRMIQLGMKDEVLNSRTIWICATCATCTSRCPRNVDLAKIMDACRVMAGSEGRVENAKAQALMHELFMESITKHGRIYELGFMVGLNLKSGKLFRDDWDIGLPTVLKGKLKFLPPRFKGSDAIAKIAAAVKEMEGEA